MGQAIQRPIFIIGSGRSGTTIFYNLLAGHRSLGWFSSFVQRYENCPWLASLSWLYRVPCLVKRGQNERWMPKPIEGHIIWDIFHPVENSLGGPPLVEQDVVAADVGGMRRYIADILRFSRCSRFLNKNTRNTRRSRYLHAIFPDALFIHIIRDGRAVTNSFLNIDWWPTLSIWWADGKTPIQLEREGVDRVLTAARMWKSAVTRVFQDKECIPPDQYVEIRYEKLMQDPMAEMKRVLDFCDLPWTSRFQAHIGAFEIKTMNFKWVDRFTPGQIAAVEKEIGPLMEQLEYT
jgi:LPS sulfotransferase NodH